MDEGLSRGVIRGGGGGTETVVGVVLGLPGWVGCAKLGLVERAGLGVGGRLSAKLGRKLKFEEVVTLRLGDSGREEDDEDGVEPPVVGAVAQGLTAFCSGPLE